MFNVVFFVVVISALIQGWTLPWVARKLGLADSSRSASPPITVEISSLRHVEGDIADYTVMPTRAAGRLVKELALPEGAVIAIITRADKMIPPQGNTRDSSRGTTPCWSSRRGRVLW